jgi:hypothetical protein
VEVGNAVSFAEGTTVPVEKSSMEIERLARKYGAKEYGTGWGAGTASVIFQIKGRRVRFTIDLPDAEWSRKKFRMVDAKKMAAEERRRWRCLLLRIKGKLESVESGIAEFDEEFLAHVVDQTGQTVWERVRVMQSEGRPMLPPLSP